MDKNEYYIVNKSVLPDYYEKVIAARTMIRTGEAKDVTDAVKMAGISRSTFYKYKDLVYKANRDNGARRAVISMMLHHTPGTLGKVLNKLTDSRANVFTISQNPPVGDRAMVVISIIINELNCELSELIEDLSHLEGVENPTLVDMA